MKKLLSVVLVLTMLMTLFVPFASAQELDNNIPSTSLKKEVYANGKVWFDLNGNAKFFINTEADDYADRFTMEFLPGVDYSGFVKKPTGDFATDKAAIISLGTGTGRGGAAMPYTIDANPKNPTASTPADFKTDADGNLWYTFEENTYLIRPEENVLKFAKTVVDTSSLTDKAKIKRYESLDKGTIDVPDAKYSKVGLFIAIRYNYAKAVNVAFHYKGESLPEEKIIDLTTKEYYKEDLYFNNLAQKNSDYDYNCMHAFTNLEFEINADKILEKIVVSDPGVDSAGTTRNPDVPIHVISAWGEELSLVEKIAKLESLNTAGVTNTEGYEKVVEAIEDIDAYLVNHEASLTEEQKVVYDAAKENLVAGEEIVAQEKAYAQPKKWFEFKGNAKLFMLYNSEEYRNRITATDYLPGLDYGGGAQSITGTFATDKTAVAAFGSFSDEFAMFPYTIDNGKVPLAKADANTITDFTTKNGNLYWNIKGKDYLVRPDKEVVKVAMNVSTSNITDAEKKAKYATLAGYTIDIPDGRYDKIGLLAGIFHTYNRSPVITLIYENGYEENETIKVAGQAVENNYRTGSQYFHPMDTKTLTTNKNYWHTFSEHEITADPSKKLTAIKITPAGNISYRYPVYVISVWGYEITVAKRIEELATLNETGVTDDVSFEVVKEAVDIIDNKLSETGVTSSALNPEDKAIYDTAKANLTAFETTFKNANDNLVVKSELEFKGNSKLFMDSTSEAFANKLNLINYYPGLDYAGLVKTPTGDFEQDYAGTNNTFGDFLACFGYTIDKGTKPAAGTSIPDFKKAENGKIYWTVNDIDYMVRPEEKTIKLSEGVSLAGIKDEAIKAKYRTLQEYTFDVPKGKYNSLTFLAGIMGAETYHRDANITLIYEDGTTDDDTFNVISTKVQSLTWAKGGVSFPRMISSTAAVWTRDYHTFAPYTVEADETKVLKAVKLTAVERSTGNAYKYPIYIVSISGSHTIKEVLSSVSADMPKADAKVILDAVNKTLADNDITADELTDETKAKYDLAKVAASALEVKSATFADSKVTVSYETEVDKAVKVIVVEYDDEDETLFNKATILPVVFNAESKAYEAPFTATGSKVKVFVWKDMINFFPYK